MKCLQVVRPGDLRSSDPEKKGVMEVREVPEPQITSPTEVKIKVAYCAICAADPHVAQNIFGRTPPYGMGHEISGVIVEMGSGVNTKEQSTGLVLDVQYRNLVLHMTVIEGFLIFLALEDRIDPDDIRNEAFPVLKLFEQVRKIDGILAVS